MNTKEKILSVIHGLADDVSIDEAIERLHLLQKIEAGLKDADEGRVMDHDEFMRELSREQKVEVISIFHGARHLGVSDIPE